MVTKINTFSKKLEELNKKKEIQILYRGISKKDAFKVFKLDAKLNSIQQYAEKLFFFGNKAIHFITGYEGFDVNDVSDEIFEFIFEEYHNLANTDNERTEKFIKKNQRKFDYFFNISNKSDFITRAKSQEIEDVIKTRNYLLTVLHQIGNFTKYKKKSSFVSSSVKKNVAEKFSCKGIIIKFWKLRNLKNEYSGIYLFNSFVYSEQKEDSVFSAIFPHYIFSVEYNGVEYVNPYLKNYVNIDYTIIFGFDIIQDNFESKLKTETLHDKCVKYDGSSYVELKI